MESSNAATADREMVVTRLIAAPRELVWRAFTEEQHVGLWWGPNGFTNTTHAMDVRAGGEWRFTMHGPDGRDYENRIAYTTVDPISRLAYDHFGHGDTTEPHFKGEINLADEGKVTRVTARMLFPSAEIKQQLVKEYGADKGAQENFNRLASYAQMLKDQADPERKVASDFKVESSGELDIVLSRTFDAPAELLWEAMSKAEHMAQWWGPRGYALSALELDFREGGSWRAVQRDRDGNEHSFHGEIRQIVPQRKLVQTFIYDPWPDHVSVETMTLEPLADGKTKLTVVSTQPSSEARAAMLGSGMEWGARQTWDRLEEFAQALK